VDTISEQIVDGRRRRRTHNPEFKADAIAACKQLGVSIAAVAQSRGVNANLLRRWVQAAEQRAAQGIEANPPRASPSRARVTSFVPVQLPTAAAAGHDIRIELRRGATSMTISWPIEAAEQCAVWIRELLR
jgi:transposase